MKQEKTIYPFRVFTILALSFLLGIFLASLVNINWQISWPILLLTLILLLFSALVNFNFKNHILILLSWSLIIICLSLSWYSFFSYKTSITLPYDNFITFEGRVIRKPQKDYKKQKITLEVINTNGTSGDTGDLVDSQILVNAPHYPEYRYGDIIKVSGKLLEPGVIEDFDYGKYLRRYLIFGVMYQPEEFNKLGQDQKFMTKFIKGLYSVSHAFEGSLNRSLKEPQASLAAGLILGIKRNIPDQFLENLNQTGLTHIIALSGYNVTIIISALSLVFASYIGRKKVFWWGLFLVIAFVILTGGAPSVVRAAIFSMLILFGKTIGRRGDQTNLMLLAAVVMVMLNPYILRDDLGFQLSFLAFAGLIYLSPLVGKVFDQDNPSRFAVIRLSKKLPASIKSPLQETLAAQIMVTPLILVAFGRISLISPLANVLVLWIIPWSMLGAFIAGLGGIIYYPIGKVLAFLLWPMLEYIVVITQWLSKIPLSSFEVEKGIWVIGAGLYLILISVVVKWMKMVGIKL